MESTSKEDHSNYILGKERKQEFEGALASSAHLKNQKLLNRAQGKSENKSVERAEIKAWNNLYLKHLE